MYFKTDYTIGALCGGLYIKIGREKRQFRAEIKTRVYCIDTNTNRRREIAPPVVASWFAGRFLVRSVFHYN